MIPNRCLILRNAAGVTELVPLDKVLHVEYTEAKPNMPQYYEERLVLRLVHGEPLTISGPEAAAVWRQLVFHFDAGTLLERDGSTQPLP